MDSFGTALLSGGVSVVIGFGASLLTMWRNAGIVDQRLSVLDKGDVSMSSDLKQAVIELRAVAEQMKVMNAEQAVINRVTTKTLDSIMGRLDNHESRISEHGARLSLLLARSTA